MNILPFDILLSVFDVLDSPKSLYLSCLVSKTFYEAAIPSLYRDIDLRPLYSDIASKVGILGDHPIPYRLGLYLERRQSIKYRALETIEKLPHLRSYVRTINQWGE
jgi:F-box-like